MPSPPPAGRALLWIFPGRPPAPLSARRGLASEVRDAVAFMRLDDIVALLHPRELRGWGPGAQALQVTDLAYDSRTALPGSLFFCRAGQVDDGHRYAGDAVAAGAVALVCERPLAPPVPQLVVADAREAMNALAAPFFGHPSRELTLVGVTGTNGKTTTAYMLEAIFTAAGSPAGLVSTVETRLPGWSAAGSRTTPESTDLQRLLRRMVDAGVRHCAMEVTSIGLVQGRVEGTSFAVSIFTNLTQDHLDYHGDLDSYYQAKRLLFTDRQTAQALVNADDPYGDRLLGEIEGLPAASFGLDNEADVRATAIVAGTWGSRFRARGRIAGRELDEVIEVNLPGRFNVANALGAAAAAAAVGVAPDAIVEGLRSLRRVPGRFDLVDEGQDFSVVVDYAHTPDALARLLTAARELLVVPPGGPAPSVIAVFGSGGHRDRAKRPLMGTAAAERADLVYVTSDNPRGEDPEAILADIEAGIAPAPPRLGHHLLADRTEAIGAALRAAGPGDVVVIAGKGHERTQDFGDRAVSFDDAEVAAGILRSMAGSPAARPARLAPDGSR